MRTRGHASEEKAEDGEEVEAAEERTEKEDEKGLQTCSRCGTTTC